MKSFKQFLFEGDIVLLAKPWQNEDVTGWWMSEKLDGVRALWTGTKFLSRKGNPFNAPLWFIEDFPKIELDGELFAGRKQFNKTVSVVKKKIPIDGEWKRLKFRVFDAPGVSGPFESRLQYFKSIKSKYIKYVRHTKVKNNLEVNKELKRVEALGAEGLMVRKPGSAYERKRSSTLLKIKSFLDGEAVLIGYQAGEGKHVGRMGALIVKQDGKQFKIGTGFTDKERENPPKIGSIITFKYQELTPKGIPRFPSFDRIRQDAYL